MFSYINRRSVTTFFGVSALTFLAKTVIAGKDLLIADRYGRKDVVDAFLIAWLIPSFVAALLGNAMSTALIPVYLRNKEKEGPMSARRLFSDMNGLLVAGSAILALVLLATQPFYLPAMASAFSGSKTALSYRMLTLLIPYIFCSGVVACWSAVLNAEEQFTVVVLSPVVSPLAILLCMLVLPGQGIYAVIDGTLIGITGELVVLGAALRSKGFSLLPSWRRWSAPIAMFVRQFLPSVAGGVLMGSTLVVDQAMAAMLPAGSVATLSYANKAIGFLLAILTTALTTVLTPYLSRKVIRLSPDRLWSSLWPFLLPAFLCCGVLCLIISAFSAPLVQLIFFRGAFTMEDVQKVATVQSWLVWQIPFYLSSVVLVRFIAAMQQNRIIPYIAAFNVVLNVALNFLLMKTMRVEGIALSTSLVHMCSFFLLLLFIYSSKNNPK